MIKSNSSGFLTSGYFLESPDGLLWMFFTDGAAGTILYSSKRIQTELNSAGAHL